MARPSGVHSVATNPALAEQDMEDRVRASAASAVSRDPRLRAALAAARENDAARVGSRLIITAYMILGMESRS